MEPPKQVNATLKELSLRTTDAKSNVGVLENTIAELEFSAALTRIVSKRRVYHSRTNVVSCQTHSKEPACRWCSDGTLQLSCVDGYGMQKPLQDCKGKLLPPIVNSLQLVQQNETVADYKRPHVVGCCPSLAAFYNCACEEGFRNESYCSECLPGYFGDSCEPCECSSHGICADGIEGTGQCLCHDRWAGPSCADCDKFHFGENCSVEIGYQIVKQLSFDHASIGDRLGSGGVTLSLDGSMLIASSPDESVSGEAVGAVHIWMFNQSLYRYETSQRLVAPNTSESSVLGGGGVALSADNTFLVTSALVSVDLDTTVGVLHIWRKNTTTSQYGHFQKLFAPPSSAGDYVGQGGVGLNANATVIGAADDDDGSAAELAGAVFLWIWNETLQVFEYRQKLTVTNATIYARLGVGGVTVSWNGSTLIAAAPNNEVGGVDYGGAIHIWHWDKTSSLFANEEVLWVPDGSADSTLGTKGVTLSQDSRFLAASGHRDNGILDDQVGAVHVWIWNDTLTQYEYLEKLLAPDGVSFDRLSSGGVTLSHDGSILTTSTLYTNDKTGSLYVWRWNETVLSFVFFEIVTVPNGVPGDSFGGTGIALSANGAFMVSSSSLRHETNFQSGAIYFAVLGYEKNASVMTHTKPSEVLLCLFPFTGKNCSSCVPRYMEPECKGCPRLCGFNDCIDNETCLCPAGRTGMYCDCGSGRYCLMEKFVEPSGGPDRKFGEHGVTISPNARIIAAPSHLDSEVATASGALHVWSWNEVEARFTYRQKLTVPEGTENQKVGEGGVSFSGSGNVLAAASYRTDFERGRLYLWLWNQSALQYDFLQQLSAPDADANDWLGLGGAALSNDGLYVAAGAPFGNSVYVWKWNETMSGYSFFQTVDEPDTEAGDKLGYSRPAMSYNATTLAAAAPFDGEGGEDKVGSVYVWRWNVSDANFTFHQKLLAPNGRDSDRLGLGAIALSDDGAFLVAAAPFALAPSLEAGAVFVWTWNASSSRYIFLESLFAPKGFSLELGKGGLAMSNNGSVLAAASSTNSDAYRKSGAVYLWEWDASAFSFALKQQLIPPDASPSDWLGLGGPSLSADGSFVAAASSGDDDEGAESGAFYVWSLEGTEPF